MPATARSLVVPAFNESARLAAGYERLRPTLEALGDDTEIVMVDDGSSDDTMRVAHQVYGHLEHFRLVQHPHNMGKGTAVRTGMAHARSEKVIVADADMSIHPRHFPDMFSALDRADMAPGSRAVNGHIRYDSVVRTVAGGVFHSIVHHYTKTGVRDTQCGCKGFRLAPGRLLALLGLVNGYTYDVELFYLARQLELVVEPVAVTWDDIGGSTVHFTNATRQLLHDVRNVPRTQYRCPVVELDAGVDLTAVRRAAIETRSSGLVVARNAENALVALARNAAVNAIGLAEALGGSVRTASLEDLRARQLEAV